MMSPLYNSHELFENGWEMTNFHREAAALTGMAEFWAEVETEAENLDIVPPADGIIDEENIDWAVDRVEPEEHKDKLVHHDCMWAGSCADSAHPSNTFVPAEPVTATAGQSLLRRAPTPPRPETPLSLDEEEPPQFRHTVDVAGTAQRLLRDSAAVAADHSYTLAKPAASKQHAHRLEALGVQTPSDSEEEIDVVSVGEKAGTSSSLSSGRAEALPRVPSAMDRHNIQRSVASAITPRPAARKRLSPPEGVTPPRNKRMRGAGRRARRSPTASDSDAESPEIERRSLHNDMERMRRIGLKNLFDELKNQIPATRDKERAPKVVILREAASICRRLQSEDAEREHLKRQQTKLLTKLRKLRSLLAARYNTY